MRFAFLLGAATLFAAPDTASEQFELKVRPILANRCYGCHSSAPLGGLAVNSRNGLLKGGKSGAAVIPGKPEESLLVKRIGAQEMPPPKLQEQYSVRGLTDDELAKVRQWIADGARADTEQPLAVSVASEIGRAHV